MNRKGFTLIELLATIVILAMVIGISSYAITSLIKRSKEKNYDLLISNIKDASELYYQECKYADGGSNGITCEMNDSNYVITLGKLVQYGYLKGNSRGDDSRYTIVNPKDNKSISDCEIRITYSNGKVNVSAITTSGSCPTEY